MAKISDLLGETLTEVSGSIGDSEIYFKTQSGKEGAFTIAEAETGNDVQITVDDICGDLDDLIGQPLIQSEESSSQEGERGEGFTWTFYRFATRKGFVTIKFYGRSNGYYSETAEFELIK